MKNLILALALVLFIPYVASAFTLSVTGAEVTVIYAEPTVNADGSPLVDLDHTTIFHDFGAGGFLDVLATTLTGGGIITQTLTVPVLAGVEANVDFWLTASDTSGNESTDSPRVTLRIDRLAPGPPQ